MNNIDQETWVRLRSKETGGVSCCFTAAHIALTVYLAIYAFSNPDNEAWVGTAPNGEFQLYESEAAAAGATDLINIHQRFVGWFMWGFFIIFASPCTACLLAGIAVMCSNKVSIACACFLGCGNICVMLAWWIAGIAYRFSQRGKYACGDFVPEGMS